MKKITSVLLVLALAGAALAIGACREPQKRGGTSQQTGTPPPSAGSIPPPLPPGKVQSSGGMR